MKFSELAQSSAEELSLKIKEMKDGYMKMRFQHATGQLDSSAKMKTARRDIARALTAVSQRAKAQAGKETK